MELEKLSDQEHEEIVKVLSDIHKHGVLHGDIRPDKILAQRDCNGFKTTFIDFAFSKRVSNKEECMKEMSYLKKMLGLRHTIGNGRYIKIAYAL